MQRFIITSLLILSALVVRADDRLILAKVENASHLYSLFENQDLTIHYYSDSFVIASLEEGKTIEQESVVLDEKAFSDVTSYAIVYCYEEEKEAYLKKISGSSKVLYSGENFFIMKRFSEGFMPAKNDGMVSITQTTAYLPQRTFTYPVVTEPDPIVQYLTEMVNTDSIIATVQHLEDYGTRRCDHANSVLAQNWIKEQYEALGLDVELHTFPPVYPWWGGTCLSGNVIAIQHGTDPEYSDEYIVCGGHYDSFAYKSPQGEPGADDNATGTAGILEIARILSQYEFKRSIIYCAFTAEECGLDGSAAYALRCNQQGMNILGYFNIDMSGYLKPSATQITISIIRPPFSADLDTYYTNIANIYFPEVIVTHHTSMYGDSDHSSFVQNGYQGIYPFEDNNNYSPYIHTSNDLIGPSVNKPEQCRVFTQVSFAAIATLAGIIYEPILPIAAFTASETTILEGDTIQFTDLSMNDPIEWQWYFEGGTPEESTEQHPEVVLYENPGIYSVKLIVTNEHGCDSLTRSNYITVNMLPPDAAFEAEVTTIEESETVSFTNLSQQKHPTTYSWFFEGGYPMQSSLENPPVIRYNKAGTYSVRLKAKNEGGETIEQKNGYITVMPKIEAITDISTGSIAIYPNPTDGELQITNYELRIENIEIFDVFGRLCHVETHGRASLQLDISHLPSGVYFIRIQTENSVVTRKVVKN